MKDQRLDEQFKEYFDGVEIPQLPNNIVADAKKSVKRRESKLPRIAKIASIAASFVLVFAVAAVLIARTDFSAFQPDDGADAPAVVTYNRSELRYDEANAYTLSKIDGSLKFIENLAYKSNSEVKSAYISHFADEQVAFVYAEVTIIAGARYDAEIYVEFTEKTFDDLKEYTDGTEGVYRGNSYRLTKEIADNGEPVNKLLYGQNGYKYYFNVHSSDENSYIKCLEMLMKN